VNIQPVLAWAIVDKDGTIQNGTVRDLRMQTANMYTLLPEDMRSTCTVRRVKITVVDDKEAIK
jgi:hypothetical protein